MRVYLRRLVTMLWVALSMPCPADITLPKPCPILVPTLPLFLLLLESDPCTGHAKFGPSQACCGHVDRT